MMLSYNIANGADIVERKSFYFYSVQLYAISEKMQVEFS